MPILPLPATASYLITSTHLLVTPVSAVKELIDNSLDAAATSISIELSANTIDIIQVKDNGHGIPPTDRVLFGRRGCTSKIRDEKDLAVVGGRSFGFRGVAVSALAGVCGDKGRRVGVCESVLVTTRVEGEDVARSWEVGRWDGGNGFEAVSHPVGTTMKLTGFFATLPVRKQEAIKNVAKTLATIRVMLQAYAMSRPMVRFSLKVLRAKNHKDNWTFASCKPSASADDAERLIREATAKIISKDCASQCTFARDEEGDYRVFAFLPSPDANVVKISGHRHFLQLDGRPVSGSRGIFKKIVSQWREAMKKAGLVGVKEGFMWLNIQYPPGAYDINIEPAKDDVIFTGEDVVLSLTARLFEKAYPRRVRETDPDWQPTVAQQTDVPKRLTRSRSRALAQEEIVDESPPSSNLIARPRSMSSTTEVNRHNDPPQQPAFEVYKDPVINEPAQPTASAQSESNPWQTNMYRNHLLEGIEEAAYEARSGAQADEEFDDGESEAALNSVAINNPWVIAKVTGANKIKNRSSNTETTPSPTILREKSGNARHTTRPAPSPQISSTGENAAPIAGLTQTTLPFRTPNRINAQPPLCHNRLPTPIASSSPMRRNGVDDAVNSSATPRRPIYPPSPAASLSEEEAALLAARQPQAHCERTSIPTTSIEPPSRSPTPFGTPMSAIPTFTRGRPRPRGTHHSHATPSDAPKPWSPFKSHNARGSGSGRGRSHRGQPQQREQFIGLSDIGPMPPSMTPEPTPYKHGPQLEMVEDWVSGALPASPRAQHRIAVGPTLGDEQSQRFAQESIHHSVPSGSQFTPINVPSRARPSDNIPSQTVGTTLPPDPPTMPTRETPTPINERPPPRRRNTRTRTKSHNPLPKSTSTQSLVQKVHTSPSAIKMHLRKLDAIRNHVAYTLPAFTAYDGFATGSGGVSERQIKRWAMSLRSLVAAMESVSEYADAIRQGLEKMHNEDDMDEDGDEAVPGEGAVEMRESVGQQMQIVPDDGGKGEEMLF